MVEPYTRLVRSTLTTAEVAELKQVDRLADDLSGFLERERPRIDAVHIHGAGSKAVQDLVADLLCEELGFGTERVLTPEDGLVTRARPDFFFRLSPGRVILAEVERGGTTTNNHDLKDMWKAHIAPDAQHLFLIVPLRNWAAGGLPREKPYQATSRRLRAFFGDARREVDVVSVHVFGYGKSA